MGYVPVAAQGGGRGLLTDVAVKVLAAGETTVPSTGSGAEVAVYRGVLRVGSVAWRGGSGGAGGPFTCPMLTLARRDGSSWVVCIGGGDQTSMSANAMVFGSSTRNRSAGREDGHTGLADTNAGVATWSGAVWRGGDVRSPGRHGVEMWALELLSG